jgi:hypothetical protein
MVTLPLRPNPAPRLPVPAAVPWRQRQRLQQPGRHVVGYLTRLGPFPEHLEGFSDVRSRTRAGSGDRGVIVGG